MADARQTDAWNRTAALLALTANLHRDPRKTQPFKPGDFHPHLKRRPVTIEKAPISILKTVFVDRRLPDFDSLARPPITTESANGSSDVPSSVKR